MSRTILFSQIIALLHTKQGQAVPEMSLFYSDHMQLDWTISGENVMKKPELNTDDVISLLGYFTASHDLCPRPLAVSGLILIF